MKCLSLQLSALKSVYWKLRFIYFTRTYGFQCFISECSRVKQDDKGTSNISMAASAKTGCSVFTSWEAEWGDKMVGSHGTNHSRGVMNLFKPKLGVNTEQIICDKNGRYILAKVLVEGDKFVFRNIYTSNDQTQQVQFLRVLSNSVLNKYAGERMVLGET